LVRFGSNVGHVFIFEGQGSLMCQVRKFKSALLILPPRVKNEYLTGVLGGLGRLDEAVPEGVSDDLGTAAQVQLVEDVVEVELHGALAEHEARGQVAVGGDTRDQELQYGVRQRFMILTAI
jgi:hypothetical protein